MEHKKRIVIITSNHIPIIQVLIQSAICEVIGVVQSATKASMLEWQLICIYNKIRNKNLKSYVEGQKIPYFFMGKSSGKLENWLKNLKPDLIIVYSMSQLLKENIFSIPIYGTINLHPSLLPKYRGPNPVFWMYYNMEKECGVTVHYIDKGEDTGDIIYQENISVQLGLKFSELEATINEVGSRLLLKAIENIENVTPIKQSVNSPTRRARNLKDGDHSIIIDWENWSVERIWHLLRGCETFLKALPNPKGFYWGTYWIIDGYNYEVNKNKERRLGQIVRNEQNKKMIICKDGIIYIHNKMNIGRSLYSFYKLFKHDK